MIPLPSELLKQEELRLNKEQQRLLAARDKVNHQLSNQEFVTNAPPALIAKQRELLERTQKELDAINSKLAQL